MRRREGRLKEEEERPRREGGLEEDGRVKAHCWIMADFKTRSRVRGWAIKGFAPINEGKVGGGDANRGRGEGKEARGGEEVEEKERLEGEFRQ